MKQIKSIVKEKVKEDFRGLDRFSRFDFVLYFNFNVQSAKQTASYLDTVMQGSDPDVCLYFIITNLFKYNQNLS